MENLYKTIFCERLKEIRAESECSQKNIANKLGIPLSTYANWEQGRTEPSIEDIFKLLIIYGIDANDLFDKDSLKNNDEGLQKT